MCSEVTEQLSAMAVGEERESLLLALPDDLLLACLSSLSSGELAVLACVNRRASALASAAALGRTRAPASGSSALRALRLAECAHELPSGGVEAYGAALREVYPPDPQPR